MKKARLKDYILTGQEGYKIAENSNGLPRSGVLNDLTREEIQLIREELHGFLKEKDNRYAQLAAAIGLSKSEKHRMEYIQRRMRIFEGEVAEAERVKRPSEVWKAAAEEWEREKEQVKEGKEEKKKEKAQEKKRENVKKRQKEVQDFMDRREERYRKWKAKQVKCIGCRDRGCPACWLK